METSETHKSKKRSTIIWTAVSIAVILLIAFINRSGLFKTAPIPTSYVVDTIGKSYKTAEKPNTGGVAAKESGKNIPKAAGAANNDVSISPSSLLKSPLPVRTPAPLKPAAVDLSQTYKPVNSSMLSTSVPTKSPQSSQKR